MADRNPVRKLEGRRDVARDLNVETTEGTDQLVSWFTETLLTNTHIHRIYLGSSRANTSAATSEVSEVIRNLIYVLWPA
jgi:hypothetical protein